jgi:cell pole-organizing protein PopZ
MDKLGDEKRDDDMSMEDILASIRKYVTDDASASNSSSVGSTGKNEDMTIKLEESQIVKSGPRKINEKTEDSHALSEEVPVTYTQSSSLSQGVADSPKNRQDMDLHTSTTISGINATKTDGPFNRLASALKAYGKPERKSPTIDEFFEEIATLLIKKWMDNNLPSITERIIEKEIEKLKGN